MNTQYTLEELADIGAKAANMSLPEGVRMCVLNGAPPHHVVARQAFTKAILDTIGYQLPKDAEREAFASHCLLGRTNHHRSNPLHLPHTMNTPNDGGPAFPVPDSHYPNGQVQYGSNGMSLRDWFAGQALAGMLTHTSLSDSPSKASVWAYWFADAMLKARNKEVAP